MDDLDRYYQATLEYQMLGTPELEKEIESLETKIKVAIKLQELVKAQILYEDEFNKPFNDYERTALYLLETLVEESEK